MRSRIAAVCALSALVLGAPQPAEPAVNYSNVAAMLDGDRADPAWFSPGLRRRGTVALIDAQLTHLHTILGAFRHLIDAGPFTCAEFERGKLELDVSFDRGGRIDGLVFLRPPRSRCR